MILPNLNVKETRMKILSQETTKVKTDKTDKPSFQFTSRFSEPDRMIFVGSVAARPIARETSCAIHVHEVKCEKVVRELVKISVRLMQVHQ
jgi:hypothetical protein